MKTNVSLYISFFGSSCFKDCWVFACYWENLEFHASFGVEVVTDSFRSQNSVYLLYIQNFMKPVVQECTFM